MTFDQIVDKYVGSADLSDYYIDSKGLEQGRVVKRYKDGSFMYFCSRINGQMNGIDLYRDRLHHKITQKLIRTTDFLDFYKNGLQFGQSRLEWYDTE